MINIIEEERDMFFSTKLACPRCGTNYPEVSPRLFSFNSPFGACTKCRGLGYKTTSREEENVANLTTCPACDGFRLRREALAVEINGVNIGELSSLSIKEASAFLEHLKLTKSKQFIASKILMEIRERLHFLNRVGLGYLTLSRPAASLSSGEEQRIKLATQIGSSLSGVLYIFDEPSIGLHPRDCGRLLDSLCRLKEMGNTVIVVEHDEDTMKIADRIVDMGPGAGVKGGHVVSEGSLAHISADINSLTGAYLRGQMSIPVPKHRRKPRDFIIVKGAKEFNLKSIDAKIPLGVLTCITGVSGSGKSTLIIEILYKALAKKIYSSRDHPGRHESIQGIEKIDKVIDVDQSPLGRTPRSNPATYSGIFTYVRTLFSQVPDARVRGYRPSRFSFNVSGGRCESCRGDGLVKVSMHFLPDVYVPCEVCRGSRYNKETLNVLYKGKNISDVLNMTVAQALEFFGSVPLLRKKLSTLDSVGLGYMQLGQSATTLSGGEAQRVKLSRELGKKATGKTLYILDEPTTGLHFVDIQKLIDVLSKLVDAGNSVVIIEHNLDIIKSADYIIDLGPESGNEGGNIIASGTPEDVASKAASHTGQYLRRKLNGKE
jgi:excinuclease ABC subunit A